MQYLIFTVFIYMLCWFVVAIVRKDNGIADIAWGLGFILIAFVLSVVYGIQTPLQWLLNGLVAVWGIRLSVHIFLRNNRRLEEDFRYKQWREEWGKQWQWRTFWQVFMLQGFFMAIIALPIYLCNTAAFYAKAPLLPSFLEIVIRGVGGLLYCIGLFWESVSDYQLLQFKQNSANKGRIMTTGLWQYSRHPNYFGEMLIWWGLALLAVTCGHQWALAAFVSPIVLTWLLLRVSGVPMLERKYQNNPEFMAYTQQTPAFFPRFW